MTRLSVGGLVVEVAAGEAVAAALVRRVGAFLVAAGPADVRLAVDAGPGPFDDDARLDLPPLRLAVAGSTVRIAGPASTGRYDVLRAEGTLDGASNLGEVDALLRLALSLALPARGALLVHGAAVAGPRGQVVLLGASGAGKSTAAAAFAPSLADELLVLSVDEGRLVAHGTPWWRGLPASARVAGVIVLERAGRGAPVGRAPLVGGAAVRALASHLVRYVALPEQDRAHFALLARVAAAAAPLSRLVCPDGDAYLPFLRAALDDGAPAG